MFHFADVLEVFGILEIFSPPVQKDMISKIAQNLKI